MFITLIHTFCFVMKLALHYKIIAWKSHVFFTCLVKGFCLKQTYCFPFPLFLPEFFHWYLILCPNEQCLCIPLDFLPVRRCAKRHMAGKVLLLFEDSKVWVFEKHGIHWTWSRMHFQLRVFLLITHKRKLFGLPSGSWMEILHEWLKVISPKNTNARFLEGLLAWMGCAIRFADFLYIETFVFESAAAIKAILRVPL